MKRIALSLLLACAAAPQARASEVAAHAMVVAGQAAAPPGAGIFACHTSGPQVREAAFFGLGIPLPAEGYSYCNLAGGIDNRSRASGTTLASQSVNAAFNGGIAAMSADSRAGFDELGVQSLASFDGSHDSSTYTYSEAAAYSTDSIFLPGAGAGSVLLKFDIGGAAQGSDFSDTLIYLNYQLGGGPIYTAFVGRAGRGASLALAPTGGPLTGFTLGPGSLSGSASDIPSFLLPVTLGSNVELSLGLYVASFEGNRPGELGFANASFLSTASLSGLYLYDAFGTLVDTPLQGESGTIYDRFGAHVPGAVPEPSTWALLVLGFAIVGNALRARRNLAANRGAPRSHFRRNPCTAS